MLCRTNWARTNVCRVSIVQHTNEKDRNNIVEHTQHAHTDTVSLSRGAMAIHSCMYLPHSHALHHSIHCDMRAWLHALYSLPCLLPFTHPMMFKHVLASISVCMCVCVCACVFIGIRTTTGMERSIQCLLRLFKSFKPNVVKKEYTPRLWTILRRNYQNHFQHIALPFEGYSFFECFFWFFFIYFSNFSLLFFTLFPSIVVIHRPKVCMWQYKQLNEP